jgi:hypothetical protein
MTLKRRLAFAGIMALNWEILAYVYRKQHRIKFASLADAVRYVRS